ncbi:Tn3 family transposase [Streptomyces sp. NPDC059832]|uniref:Tn3 family transposase n=1 Tax=Streptomyces sp. NPDC059832 TaxID=3346966 RepID=UPI00365C1CEA
MRVIVSIREGTISSTLLLKRIRSGSRRNATYTAFREIGRVIRTVQLLRCLSDAPLCSRVTAASTPPTVRHHPGRLRRPPGHGLQRARRGRGGRRMRGKRPLVLR